MKNWGIQIFGSIYRLETASSIFEDTMQKSAENRRNHCFHVSGLLVPIPLIGVDHFTLLQPLLVSASTTDKTRAQTLQQTVNLRHIVSRWSAVAYSLFSGIYVPRKSIINQPTVGCLFNQLYFTRLFIWSFLFFARTNLHYFSCIQMWQSSFTTRICDDNELMSIKSIKYR